MKTSDTTTDIEMVEVCVYGDGRFLEMVHEGHFITLETPSVTGNPFTFTAVTVECLKTGGGHQTFERVKRFLTERRLKVPASLARKIIAWSAVRREFVDICQTQDSDGTKSVGTLLYAVMVELGRALQT